MGKIQNLAHPIESLEEPWQGHVGQEVETFITDELEKAEGEKIIRMTYENQQLVLHKANNETIQAVVSVITPTYYYGIKLYGIRIIDSDNTKIFTAANSDVTVQYTPQRKVEAGVILYAISRTVEDTDQLGPFDIKFQLGNQRNVFKVNNVPYTDCTIDNGTLVGINYPDPENHVTWVDVTSLFAISQTRANLLATVQADTSISDELDLDITIQKINLKYSSNNSVLVNTNSAQFTLEGGKVGDYHLEGFNNGVNFGRTNGGSLVLTNLTVGLNQLVVRAVHNEYSDIYTDWIYVDLIYTEGLENTVVAINKVNKTIPNNGVATLYELTIYSPNQDAATLTTYLEESEPSGENPVNNVKYEVIGAASYDRDNVYKTQYKKYMEINGTNNERYLMVKTGDTFYNFYDVFINNITGQISSIVYNYKSMIIDAIDDSLTYYQDVSPSLNFDQSTGRSNNVIITADYADNGLVSNVNPNLEISDGWKEENDRTLFRASAQASPILTTPVVLNLGTQFTIEMGFKTYNISDRDKSILTIGQFQLRPAQFCWNTDDTSLFNARNAQFEPEKEIHVVMTVEGGHSITKGEAYYPEYLGDYQAAFDSGVTSVSFNLVRIYVNGTIDREIIINDDELSTLRQASLQIAPTAADIDLYLFRVYNNTALSMDAVLKNYISFLPTIEEKRATYEANDLLDANGEISFDKCYSKYNTIVYVLPSGCRFPNRGWGKSDGLAKKDMANYPVTLFINYVNSTLNQEFGGKWTDITLTAQGSSAMRYLIWNCQTAAGKFKDKKVNDNGEYLDKNDNVLGTSSDARKAAADLKRKSAFISYSPANFDEETKTFKPEATTTYNNYYIMPPYEGAVSDDRSQITKAVGKVNFASSQQSHKMGIMKLYDDAYKNINGALLTGGRKGAREEPFLYFYWESNKLSSGSEDVTSAQNKDKDYWKTRGTDDIQKVELAELFNNPDVHFMGFQTWGSAKADNATYGYDENVTPGYLLIEGGENTDPAVNFRVPWHALQRATGEGASKTLTNAPQLTYNQSLETPWANLLIEDESIVYEERGALDVDYGVAELKDGAGQKYFEIDEKCHSTLALYRAFHDFVYKHDYTFISTGGPKTGQSWENFLAGLNPQRRYCVTAGLSWQSDSQTSYTLVKGDLMRFEEYSGKWVPAGLSYNTVEGKWDKLNVYTDITGQPTSLGFDMIKQYMKSMFAAQIGQYIDINDIAFHQALVKFASGTDNRAKNTYFQILGDIMEEVSNPEYDSETNPDVPQKIWTKASDAGNKVRLMQDDVDTVLLTDNGGLQTKPYNLLEASYREADVEYWGDSHNIFFYMFDQCFETEIKSQLKGIIDFAFRNSGDVNDKANYFYKVYFSVGDMFPAVTYNHTSKIYYENAEFIRRSQAMATFYFNNGKAPIEQAHGSSISSEKDFMSRRLNFLGSYAGSLNTLGRAYTTSDPGAGGDKLVLRMTFEPYQDFYPRYMWGNSASYYITDTATNPGLNPSEEFDTIKHLASAGQTYENVLLQRNTKAMDQALYNTELYKKLNITGLYYSNFNIDLSHSTDLTIDNNNLYNIDGQGNKTIKPEFGQLLNGGDYPELNIASFAASMPVMENLTLNNIKLPAGLDLSKFTKLKKIDLTNTNTEDITFPESGRLQMIILPSTIKTLRLYNNSGIQSITFQGISNLETVYLNCAAVGQFNINSFLESLVNCQSLKSVTLINANIYITEEALIKLCNIETFRIQGIINVVTSSGNISNLKAISLSTKKHLVEKFGDFTSPTSKVTVNYIQSNVEASSINAASSIQLYTDTYGPNGTELPNTFNVQVTSGNNVVITTDGNGKAILDIRYAFTGGGIITTGSDKEASIDPFTGKVTLYRATTKTAEVTISIRTSSSTQPLTRKCNVTFEWAPPAIGDFAYIDGTFSPGYDPNKTIVGLVYARDETSSTTGTVYIIGKEYSNSVAHYGGYTNEGNSGSSSPVIKDLAYVASILSDHGLTSYQEVGVEPQNPIQDNININNKPSASNTIFKGCDDTKAYVEQVGTFLQKIKSDSRLSGYVSTKTEIEDGNSRTVYYINDITTLNNLCNALKVLNIAGMSSADSDVISCVLYPYFYSAYLYEPTAEHGEAINDAYLKGKWYAPSYGEMSRIAYYRGYSATGTFLSSGDIKVAIDGSLKHPNGGDMWTYPIFSTAKNEMGENTIWNTIFIGPNNIVTTVAHAQENYSYRVVTDFNNVSSTKWISGADITNYWQTDTEAKQNSWRLTKHFGIPFTRFNYKKQ